MTALHFELRLDRQHGPWPTSVNALYAGTGRHRHRTREVTTWQQTVTEYTWLALRGLAPADQQALATATRLAVDLVWRVDQAHWRLDLDAPVKSVLDAVFQVWTFRQADDRRVKVLGCGFAPWTPGEPEALLVTVTALDRPTPAAAVPVATQTDPKREERTTP